MKAIILSSLVLFLLTSTCAERPNQNRSNDRIDLSHLIDSDSKRVFLEKIYKDDQAVRDSKYEASLMLKYGMNSDEHLKYVQAQWDQDEINLKKIHAYLDAFGYPDPSFVSSQAARAPWLVIHHVTDPNIRNQYFEILNRAYQSGKLEEDPMSMYLARTYEFIHRKRYQMIPSSYTAAEEIDSLIKALAL